MLNLGYELDWNQQIWEWFWRSLINYLGKSIIYILYFQIEDDRPKLSTEEAKQQAKEL